MTEAEFLKRAREEAGLTQMDVAKKLGWGSAQFISNMERGRAALPLGSVKRFIKVTKCDPDRLFQVKTHEYLKTLQGYFP